ncbi:MAG: micrococcal nuclease [Acidimicrobiia bacterium]|nr:micrococcal nuclease [Acidimicrobiia bacterium]
MVVHHVDGDTLDVNISQIGRERLRLIGIDTPETKKPDNPVECYGPEASRHLADLLPVGSEVVLLRDIEARDDYGRFLAYVFRRSDGLFVNLAMASDGYARPLSVAPNTMFTSEMSRAAAGARAAGKGLWATCPERPPKKRN